MMTPLIIYHNGECSKSKSALEILQERNIPHEVRWYLAEPLDKEEIQMLLEKLSLKPSQIVRRNEPLFKEKFEEKIITEEEWIDILVSNPILIERPIVEKDNNAIIARPSQRVLDLL